MKNRVTRRGFISGAGALGSLAAAGAQEPARIRDLSTLEEQARAWREHRRMENVPFTLQFQNEGRAMASRYLTPNSAVDFWGTSYGVIQNTECPDEYTVVVNSEGLPADPARQLIIDMNLTNEKMRWERNEQHPLTHLVSNRGNQHFVALYMSDHPEPGTDGEPSKRVDNIQSSVFNPRHGNRLQIFEGLEKNVGLYVGKSALGAVFPQDVTGLEDALRQEAEFPYFVEGVSDPKSSYGISLVDGKGVKSGLPVWKVQVVKYGSPSENTSWPQADPEGVLLTALMGYRLDGTGNSNEHLFLQRVDEESKIGGPYAEISFLNGQRTKITNEPVRNESENYRQLAVGYMPQIRTEKQHPAEGYTRAQLLGEAPSPLRR